MRNLSVLFVGLALGVTLLGCGGATTKASSLPGAHALPEAPPLPWEVEHVAPAAPTTGTVALVGGRVMTAAGDIFEPGTVVMKDGRIAAVGAAADVSVPEGAQVVELNGRTVTPGLIDTHSHMGVYASPSVGATSDGNEATSPVTAEVWAADSFWPQDPALGRALAAGVTTIQVLPGSANLIGGRGVVLKMHLGRTTSQMLFPGAPDTLKMACGENPKRVYGSRHGAPSTRMGNVAGYRSAFQGALEYGRGFDEWQGRYRRWAKKKAAFDAKEKGAEDPGLAPTPPSRDFGKEALLGAMQGRVLVQMHCYRADEMARMLEVAAEFGFKIRAFHHAVEAYKLRDVLQARDVGVSTWADWWGFKLEAFDAIEENLALLSQSGVRAVLHSDSAMLVQRLNQEVEKARTAAKREGLAIEEDEALRWITQNAAWTLGVQELTGTLEVGKMADVVIWSAHPFTVDARPDAVYVDGLLAFDRNAGRYPQPSDFELGQGEVPDELDDRFRPSTANAPSQDAAARAPATTGAVTEGAAR